MPTVGLILPASSYRGPDFVTAADELGVDLLVLTDGSLALASGRIAGVVSAPCDQPELAAEALVEAAKRTPLDAVVGVDDAGVLIAALTADRLDLPHNSPEAVAATRDKLLMRHRLAQGDVPQPDYRGCGDHTQAERAAEEIGYPIVVKPLSLSGSRGVIKASGPADLEASLARLAAIRTEAGIGDEAILVEEFVPGPEIAVEGLLSGEGLEVLAVFDKPDPLDGPFFEETLYVSPSRHDPEVVADALELVESATEALGLAFGPIHAEVRLAASGPRVIEVAARSIGGLCGRSLRFGMLGQSLEVLLLRAALGMNRRGMRPQERAAGAMMIPIPQAGVLRVVTGIEAVAEVEGVDEITITIAPGKTVRPPPEGDRYLGFIIARHDEPERVEAALREAHALLDIELEP